MKTKLVLTISVIACISLAYSSGPYSIGAGDVTGSPKSNGTCAKCHTSLGNDTTFSSLSVKRKSAGSTSPDVNNYVPLDTYTITISGINTQQYFYGFQVTALDEGDNYIGEFTTIPNIAQGKPANHPKFVEHIGRIDKDVSGGFSTSFDWVPQINYGAVTIYGIVNAVDGDAKGTYDSPSKPMSVLLAGPVDVNEIVVDNTLPVFPNPVSNGIINIELNRTTNNTYTYVLLNTHGQKVADGVVPINGKVHIRDFVSKGVYILKVMTKSGVVTEKKITVLN